MTVYLDNLAHRGMKYRGRKTMTCHMMTDGDIQELHNMAEKLGLRKYFQDHPDHPHYDLMAGKRNEAIRLGAVSVSSVELVKRCSKMFRERGIE